MRGGLFCAFLALPLHLFCLDISMLSLEDAIEIALDENKPFLISQEDVYQANQRRLQSYSKYFPKITYNSFLAHTFEPSIVENIDNATLFYKKNITMHKFELTQPLISSDLFYEIKTTSTEKKRVEEMSRQSKNELLLEVRNFYFATVFQKAQICIQRENAAYLTEALEIESGKYESGNATSLEVKQSKVAVSNSLAIYYNALKQLKKAKNALINALGIDPLLEPKMGVREDHIEIEKISLLRKKLSQIESNFASDKLFFPSVKGYEHQLSLLNCERQLTIFDSSELDELISIAMQEKPEIENERLGVTLAEEIIGQSYAKYLPYVSGFVDCQKNSGDPGARFFTRDDFSWAAGIKVSWDLFDSLLRERKIKEAYSKKTASRLRYQYAQNQVEISLRNSLYEIEEALYSYLYASQGVNSAEEAMQQARDKLIYGKIPPLDYRDAANQLAQAKNLRNMASFQLVMAYYKLRYDMGIDVANIDCQQLKWRLE